MKQKVPWLFLAMVCMCISVQAQAFMNFTIQQPAPPVAAFTSSPNGLTVSFTDQSASGITAWAWDFGDGNTSTLQNPSHTFGSEGPQTVCLTVTDQFACTSTTCDSLFLVGIAQPLLLQGVTVYPNPITQETRISYDLDRIAAVKIDVLNLLGQSLATVHEGEQPAGAHTHKLGIHLAAGIYLLRLTADGQSTVVRITSGI